MELERWRQIDALFGAALEHAPEDRARFLDQACDDAGMRREVDALLAPLLEAALDARETLFGDDHVEVATTLHHIAALHLNQGRYKESEALFQRALAIRERTARALAEKGMRDHVVGWDMTPRERAQPADDPEIGLILSQLSGVYRAQGRFDEGEDSARRALVILKKTLDRGHPEIARALRALAGIHARRGENHEAERLLEEALAIDLETFGEVHWSTASTYSNLGYLLRERSEYDQSEDSYRRAIAAWGKLRPEGHPRLADALVGLANTYRVQGRNAEAEAQLRRALPHYQRALGDEHALVANCLYELGNVLVVQGQLAEAEPFLIRARDVRERALPADHPWVAESLRGLADLRRAQQRYAEAEPLYLRALAIWEEHPHHEGTQQVPEGYAALLRATARPEAAAELEYRAATVDRASD